MSVRPTTQGVAAFQYLPLAQDLNDIVLSDAINVKNFAQLAVQAVGSPWTIAVVELLRSLDGENFLPFVPAVTISAPGIRTGIDVAALAYARFATTIPEGQASSATLTVFGTSVPVP